jgi:hypothetical protein
LANKAGEPQIGARNHGLIKEEVKGAPTAAPEKKKFPWEDDQAAAKYENVPIKSLADNKPIVPV